MRNNYLDDINNSVIDILEILDGHTVGECKIILSTAMNNISNGDWCDNLSDLLEDEIFDVDYFIMRHNFKKFTGGDCDA